MKPNFVSGQPTILGVYGAWRHALCLPPYASGKPT